LRLKAKAAGQLQGTIEWHCAVALMRINRIIYSLLFDCLEISCRCHGHRMKKIQSSNTHIYYTYTRKGLQAHLSLNERKDFMKGVCDLFKLNHTVPME